MTWLLLIIFTDGQTVKVPGFANHGACVAAATELVVPTFTNLLPENEAVRQIGLDAYCLPAPSH
jgi:acyl CoA:acetate/3-ketoacid CoA transferase alpha subunit